MANQDNRQDEARDEMNLKSQDGSEDQFDIVWVLKYLFVKRKPILIGIATAFALAMLLFAVKPKVFSTACTILPTDNSSNSLKGLSGLASMAGVNIGSASSVSGSTIITPELYPMVSTSTPTLLALIDVPLEWKDREQPMSAYEYFRSDTVMTFGRWLKKYTIRLPWTIKDALVPPPPSQPFIAGDSDEGSNKITAIQLDKARETAIEWVSSQIVVVYDDEACVVDVAVNGETPDQCAALATALLEQLQKTITEFKTKRSRSNLNFLQERYDKAVQEYEKSRADYYSYRDRHRDFVEERLDVTKQKLEDKFNLDYSLLTSLQTQVETARMQLLDDTPVFTVVEPVVKPSKKSSPKLLLHAVGGVVIGFILMVGWYLALMSFCQFFDHEKFQKMKEEAEGATIRR